VTEYAWNPRTKRQLDVMRECYEFLGIKCPESLLRAIDKDGRLSDFTPEQIKVAMETIAESRLSNGGNVFPRDVAPMNILWHLKSKRGDTQRNQEVNAPFKLRPGGMLYSDALANFNDLPEMAQKFALHWYQRSDEGQQNARAWDDADEKVKTQPRRSADILRGGAKIGTREWCERGGAAFMALRMMRKDNHPQHDEMMRLAEVETEPV